MLRLTFCLFKVSPIYNEVPIGGGRRGGTKPTFCCIAEVNFMMKVKILTTTVTKNYVHKYCTFCDVCL